MKKQIRSHCPINFFLEFLWDKWSLLILRDIVFRGKTTYWEFLKSEELFATNILANRLEQLCENGILQKKLGTQDKRSIKYFLTQKWLDLIPILFEMVLWSSKYDPKSEALRIPWLVKAIQENNREISRKTIESVRQWEAIVKKYISQKSTNL